MRRAEPGYHPRHRARGAPDPEALDGLLVERDVHLAHRRSSRAVEAAPGQSDEEVEETVGTIPGSMDQHESARAGPGQRALCHPRREPGSDARIDGVAALLQDLCARDGGQRMAGGDCASHAFEVSARGPRVRRILRNISCAARGAPDRPSQWPPVVPVSRVDTRAPCLTERGRVGTTSAVPATSDIPPNPPRGRAGSWVARATRRPSREQA
jgi:hypothetical protein